MSNAHKRPFKEAQNLARSEVFELKRVFFNSEGKDLSPLELEK
ncbi:hypothetical protein [Helicobacter felis]|nr:hypothetical protein [Helicobacter felis]